MTKYKQKLYILNKINYKLQLGNPIKVLFKIGNFREAKHRVENR